MTASKNQHLHTGPPAHVAGSLQLHAKGSLSPRCQPLPYHRGTSSQFENVDSFNFFKKDFVDYFNIFLNKK